MRRRDFLRGMVGGAAGLLTASVPAGLLTGGEYARRTLKGSFALTEERIKRAVSVAYEAFVTYKATVRTPSGLLVEYEGPDLGLTFHLNGAKPGDQVEVTDDALGGKYLGTLVRLETAWHPITRRHPITKAIIVDSVPA